MSPKAVSLQMRMHCLQKELAKHWGIEVETFRSHMQILLSRSPAWQTPEKVWKMQERASAEQVDEETGEYFQIWSRYCRESVKGERQGDLGEVRLNLGGDNATDEVSVMGDLVLSADY